MIKMIMMVEEIGEGLKMIDDLNEIALFDVFWKCPSLNHLIYLSLSRINLPFDQKKFLRSLHT